MMQGMWMRGLVLALVSAVAIPAAASAGGEYPDPFPPVAAIDVPPPPKVKTKKKYAKVRLGFSGPAGATFVCRADNKPFAACVSPRKWSLRAGRHTLEVKAIDPLGSVGPAASAPVKVIRKR